MISRFMVAAGAVLALFPAIPLAAEAISFNQEVRPILSNNCFACHGPDGATREAGLRLDEEEAVKAVNARGLAAITPGDRAASMVWQRINDEDPEKRMPPADFHRSLSEADIATLGQWIDEGAPWEDHWAYTPAQRPTPPSFEVDSWSRNTIDPFILRRLTEAGLTPSPEADRRTLIRRVAFDLTGLPPNHEAIQTFLADEAPDAYEQMVERYLDSPRYGEHLARYWLDAGRYADTNGYHIDNARYMWVWRDWVIDAFNKNLSYDEFTRWQIAGDLLPEPTQEQLIATGFQRNHMINFEGGAIPEEYRTQYVADRVDTTGTIWLGMTMSCAKCHDHKYDPISQKEYFEFYAFFNNIDEEGLDGQTGNSKPFMKAPSPEQQERVAALTEAIGGAETALAAPMPELDVNQAAWEEEWSAAVQARWQMPTPLAVTSNKETPFEALDDGSFLAGGENPARDSYTIELPLEDFGYTAIRLEALPHESLPTEAAGRAPNGNFVLTNVEATYTPAGEDAAAQPLKFMLAQADYSQPDYNIALAIDSDRKSGWAIDGEAKPGARVAYFVPELPIGQPGGGTLTLHLHHDSMHGGHNIGRFRVSLSTDEAMRPSESDTWHVNGPYQAADGKTAYATDFGPEAAFLENALDLEAIDAQGKFEWVRDPRLSDGAIHELHGEVAATYFYRTIQAPGLRHANLKVGSNDAIKIWLNGHVVHDNDVLRGVEADQDTVPVLLGPGENRLLVKVVNYGNAYAFSYRLTDEQLGALPLDIEQVLLISAAERSDEQRQALRHFYRTRNSDAYREQEAELARLREELTTVESEIPTTMVLAEREEPRKTHILIRGQYDLYGEEVQPGVPAVLPPLPKEEPPNRLALANWLLDPQHPLVSRVTVNRLWAQVFGTGLVATVEDFGVQGEWPKHPGLLDWLAVEFVESGWDLKGMLRLMLHSATYRQQSHIKENHLELDPNNRLLARSPRYRLDAEAIRDNALALSGLMTPKIGGPSVNPYQPPGMWEAVSYGSGFTAQNFVQDHGEDLYRRSMYTFWKRQSPPASMMVFDAPNREICTVIRSRTNTPLQALALMNDPQFVEASRFLAERILTEHEGGAAARLAYGFELVTARKASEAELAVLEEFLAEQLEHFGNAPEKAAALLNTGEKAASEALPPHELAAWTTIASLLLNMDMTIMRS